MPPEFPKNQQQWLSRLAPFQGQAQETILMAITGLAQVGPRPDLATGVTRSTWPNLREALIAQDWLKEQALPGGGRPGLILKPNLGQNEFAALEPDQQQSLLRHYRRHYFQLAGQFAKRLSREPEITLALARFEAANLLSAAKLALEHKEEWASEYIDRLNDLAAALDTESLQTFNTQRDQLETPVGSKAWRRKTTNHAHHAMQTGDLATAIAGYESLLATASADDEPMFLAANHAYLGRCLAAQGDADSAQQHFDSILKISPALDPHEAGRDLLAAASEDLALVILEDEASSCALKEEALKRAIRMAQRSRGCLHAAQKAWWFADQARQWQQEDCEEQAMAMAMGELELCGERHEMLEGLEDFITRVRGALTGKEARAKVEAMLAEGEAEGWVEGAKSIRLLLDGERNRLVLCRNLSLQDAWLLECLRDYSEVR